MNRNEQTEKILTDAGVKWETMDKVQISAIDIKKSLENQARVGNPLIVEQVSIYRQCIANGDVFPPVLLLSKNNSFFILDGNHRINAAREAGIEVWSYGAYVVSGISDAQYRTIIYSVNNTHGLPASTEDRVKHAIFLIDNFKMTIDSASKQMKVSSSIVSNAKRAYDLRKRAAKIGANVNSMTDTAVIEAGVMDDDNLFKRAIEIFGKNIKNSFYKDDYQKIKQARTYNEKNALFDSFEKKYDIVKKESGGCDKASSALKKYASASLSYIKSISKNIPEDIKIIPELTRKDIDEYCMKIANEAYVIVSIMRGEK